MNGMKRWIVSIICSGGALFVIGGLNVAANDLPEEPAQSTVTYTIEKGDTLWDLSRRFLDSPFRWPELWEKNAYINNPDLIFPGNQIVVTAENGSLSSETVAGGDTLYEDAVYDEPMSEEPTAELDDTLESPMEHDAGAGVVERTEAIAKPTPVPELAFTPATPSGPKPFHYPSIDHVGFVGTDPIEGVGTILREIDDNFLIGEQDRIYVKANPDAPSLIQGNVYTVYRLTQHVIDPRTGKRAGVHHFMTGKIRIDEIGEEGALATVIKSYRTLKAGDRLVPYIPRSKRFFRTPPASGLNGHVLMSDDKHSGYSESMVVFINKGRTDGVDLGQEYHLYSQEPGMPPLDIGSIMILHAEKTVSSALITQSNRTIHDGDLFRAKN